MSLARINLQLFAGEKTEPATPRRREEARRKGQVAKSAEVSTALIVLTAFLGLNILGPYLAGQLKETVHYFLENMALWQGDAAGFKALFLTALIRLALIVLPILLMFMLAGALSQVLQVGFLASGEALKPTFSRINPVEGLKRIFSKRAIMEFFKSVLKVGLIGYLVYTQVRANLNWLPELGMLRLSQSALLMKDSIYRLGLRVGLFLLVIAAFDYWYQRREFEESIKMSKDEIREELKQMEGDPLIRSRIRQRQRQIASQRMMQAVPTADVIVTNPTHFAIAIRYSPEEMAAPRVVAKGRGLIAQKIKEEGYKHRITTVEDPELARALYHTTEVGQEIPAELYPAVAEILAFVYRLQRKTI
ncbi:MAG TPA: flagellar biosynthesis protein FlhB [Firmicutes bacterium]|nr:flagellar biosynthesis protein FlhB [Bacillota bacterium]